MTDWSTFLQPALIIAVLGGMLKFLVIDKLSQITEGINGHERRIRRVENRSSALHGALMAKGCLLGGICLKGEEEEDDEDLGGRS